MEFHATAARKERHAAVDAVGGRVVGGGGSQYYIHMPGVATRPGLDSAMVRLRALPQVRRVSVYDTSPVSPHDP